MPLRTQHPLASDGHACLSPRERPSTARFWPNLLIGDRLLILSGNTLGVDVSMNSAKNKSNDPAHKTRAVDPTKALAACTSTGQSGTVKGPDRDVLAIRDASEGAWEGRRG